MAETFLKQHRQDARQDPQTYERLKTTAEDIKIALSTAETHTVMLKELGHGAGGAALNFQFTMTRRDLDALLTPLVDRSFKVTQDALTLARLSPGSFDKVILVGGSTRMPLVRKRVEAFFGGPPMDRVNPDEVVAIGAAIQAAALTEGIRRRSIPAPPGVPGRPSQNDTQDNTQTSELDPSMLKPAFGSEPPAFGFASQQGSQPPGGHLGFASTVGSVPPLTQQQQQTEAQARPPVQVPGVPGARPPAQPARRQTNPGVAPATQPMGARTAPKPAGPPTQASEDDPSMASFPDLSAPTPFEWFPSSGQPSSGPTQVRGQPAATSERTFGGNNPPTVTQTAAVTQPTAGVRPAAGAPPLRADDSAGFGAIDEPPSLFSTPSASVPSFPSMSAGDQPPVPSPLGDDPAPWRQDQAGRPVSNPSLEGQFGAVPDLSLVSTSGVSSSGVSSPDGGFGHVSDLSLISNQTATAAMEAITQARSHAMESGQFEDETEALRRDGKGRSMQLDQAPRSDKEDHDSLIDRADLPAVVQKAKPARKPGQIGMNPQGGGASMLGKPPPLIAPQPFGPMEKVDESPHSRTAAMQSPQRAVPPGAKAPPPQIAKTGPGKLPPQTAPMPARASQPNLNVTAPLGQSGPGPQKPPPAAKPRPTTEAFGSPAAAPPPFAPPAPAYQPPQPPPQAYQPPPQQGAYASSPPPMQGNFSHPPPQHHQAQHAQPQPFSFGSAPPGAFGSQPPPQQSPYASQPPQQAPPQGSSQPPIFGSFQSAPPGAPAPLDYPQNNANNIPPSPQAPQGIQYQSPVLVDVTPRGLVVETAGGYTDTIIPRNSKIPCERTRRFATGRDMQTTVRVRVAQGESPTFPQNTFLGEVELSGLRPAPRGEVTVAVTFEVDADGTLRVRARDVQTGQEARATLQLVGVADESSVVMMINRFANQPVVGGPTH
jgi:molecular chaperone DnaK